LPTVVAFTRAFGILSGVLYAAGAGLVITGLAGLSGRFLLGDLLPFCKQRKGVAPLSPAASWSWWMVVLLAAIPAVPLLLCGLWVGLFRISLLRCMAAITAGVVVRILISIVAQ
jgi:uncharacterized membrane protein YdjX (TVP38/TMEM64 family)